MSHPQESTETHALGVDMLFLTSKVVALTLVSVVRGVSTSQKSDSSLETRHILVQECLNLTMTDLEMHTAYPIIKRVMFDWPRCSKSQCASCLPGSQATVVRGVKVTDITIAMSTPA
jgi:hypothetical protein